MGKWCSYSYIGKKYPEFIGKIIKYDDYSCEIKNSNNQLYSPESWKMSYVNIFERIENAIISILLKNNNIYSLNEIKDDIRLNFKREYEKINWEDLEIIDLFIKINK
jgi:hypothetical protein